MVSTADASKQLSLRSPLTGREPFQSSLVTFGHLGRAFGAGTTPRTRRYYWDPIRSRSSRWLQSDLGVYFSPDTACNSPPVVHVARSTIIAARATVNQN